MLSIPGLCEGNPPVAVGFTSQRAQLCAFMSWGHRGWWPVGSLTKGPVMWKVFHVMASSWPVAGGFPSQRAQLCVSRHGVIVADGRWIPSQRAQLCVSWHGVIVAGGRWIHTQRAQLCVFVSWRHRGRWPVDSHHKGPSYVESVFMSWHHGRWPVDSLTKGPVMWKVFHVQASSWPVAGGFPSQRAQLCVFASWRHRGQWPVDSPHKGPIYVESVFISWHHHGRWSLIPLAKGPVMCFHVIASSWPVAGGFPSQRAQLCGKCLHVLASSWLNDLQSTIRH